MKIILAQGNPGARYTRTRHNVGWFVLDALADAHKASWGAQSKFNAEIATISIDGEKALLVKPLTYYNETGRAARAIVDFYKLDPQQDILVIHDELALPLGEIRTREKGSDAGNNGIKSLNAHLGQAYKRLRIGIYTPLRDRMDDADFVLSTLTADEAALLRERFSTVIKQLVEGFISTGELEATTIRRPSTES